jgi:hypothetical protein
MIPLNPLSSGPNPTVGNAESRPQLRRCKRARINKLGKLVRKCRCDDYHTLSAA